MFLPKWGKGGKRESTRPKVNRPLSSLEGQFRAQSWAELCLPIPGCLVLLHNLQTQIVQERNFTILYKVNWAFSWWICNLTNLERSLGLFVALHLYFRGLAWCPRTRGKNWHMTRWVWVEEATERETSQGHLGKISQTFVCSSAQVDPGHANFSLTLSNSVSFSVFFLSHLDMQETYRAVCKHFCVVSLHFSWNLVTFPDQSSVLGMPTSSLAGQKPFSGNLQLLASLATLSIHQVWVVCSSLWLRLEVKRVLPVEGFSTTCCLPHSSFCNPGDHQKS